MDFLTDPVPPIYFNGGNFCFTGNFLFGSRTVCEQTTRDIGGCVIEQISSNLDYLVVGAKGNKQWSNGKYGNKVKEALQFNKSHRGNIIIISEETWYEAIQKPNQRPENEPFPREIVNHYEYEFEDTLEPIWHGDMHIEFMYGDYWNHEEKEARTMHLLKILSKPKGRGYYLYGTLGHGSIRTFAMERASQIRQSGTNIEYSPEDFLHLLGCNGKIKQENISPDKNEFTPLWYIGMDSPKK